MKIEGRKSMRLIKRFVLLIDIAGMATKLVHFRAKTQWYPKKVFCITALPNSEQSINQSFNQLFLLLLVICNVITV